MKRIIGTVSLILALISALAACSSGGSGGGGTTSAALVSITVTPASPTIPIGISQQFSAVGTYSDNTTQNITANVTWSSSDSTKAAVDTVGRATGAAAGAATITATLNGKSATAALTVNNSTLVSMTLTPASPSIANGTSQQFAAIGIFSDNTLLDLTGQVSWSSSDTSKATINSSGLATGAGVGTTTISATKLGVNATATLTVTSATLTSLSLSPSNPTVITGGTKQIAATGSFSDGTSQDMTTQVAWTSSDMGKATINSSGLASGVSAGVCTIAAKFGAITASVSLTVNAAAPAGSVQLAGAVAPDPGDPSAGGHQSGATVYAVGQQDNSATTDSNGNYNLYINPQLSGTVLASKRFGASSIMKVDAGTTTLTYDIVVVNPDGTYGHTIQVQIVTNQSNTAPTIYINQTGSITGHAYLQNQSDNSGITVYIPGTSFSAITAADGGYTISGVPSGTYPYLRAEKFGTTYHYAILSGITVDSNQQTTVADMTLQLSTGPFGGVLINNGAAFTTSPTTTLSIATSSDAVLMSISDRSDFVGAMWVPVQATYPFTFSSPYPSGGQMVNAYIKFAQDSGLTSEPITTAIYLDTNPQATNPTPVSTSATMSTMPTLQWQYAPPMPNPQYRVQVATDPSFNNIYIVQDQGNLTQPQYQVSTTLNNMATYYWRVAIIYNGTQLSWGPAWSFQVNRNAGNPLSPANWSYTNNASPQFTWSQNQAASSYRLVLSLNFDLSNPVLDQPGIQGGSYGPISALSGTTSATYYWAITPYDSQGNAGIPSGTQEFFLDTVPPSGAITINNNDTFTGSRYVTLNLSAFDVDGVAAYYVSESPSTPSLSDPGWVLIPALTTITSSPTFTLSSGSGVKTVYAWYKDTVGNISSSSSDSINLIDFTDNITTIDQGGVGRYPSIALGYSGNWGEYAAVVDYSDLLNTGVKFMTNEPGTWTAPTYMAQTDGVTTPWSQSNHSIAYAANAPATVHVVFSNSGLYHAYKQNWQQPWIVPELIDSAGGEQWTASIASASTGTSWAYVSYQGAWTGSAYPLTFATNTTGSWVKTNVDSAPGVNAMYTSIALDPDNVHVHISYYDGNVYSDTGNKVLKYATNKLGSWATYTVDSSAISGSSDVGRFTSIAVDSANIHIAYYDNANHYIKYATKPLSGGAWARYVVDGNSTNIGGYYYNFQPISLSVDTTKTANNVFISYVNFGSSYGLKLATNYFGSTPTSWANAYVDQYNYLSNPVVPIDTSIAVAPAPQAGHTRIDMTYFDNQGEVLKYTTGQN